MRAGSAHRVGAHATRGEPRPHVGDRIEGALQQHADVEGAISRGERERPQRRSVVRTVVWLAITGVSLYLVAPTLLETLGSWRDVTSLAAGWALAMLPLEAAAFVCLWWLQRIAMRGAAWYAVATSQLPANGMAAISPGGGAVGAALQYRLLVQAGVDRVVAVSGLTAANLTTLAIVLALPVLALPSLIRGLVNRTLVEAAAGGLAIFVVLGSIGAVMLAMDGPLRWVGRVAQRTRNRLRRRAEPVRDLPSRLVDERDLILAAVGPRWRAALTAGVGRWAFDYATLLAALAAVGSTPRPTLVLLAYCTAQLLAQVPFTPGGLGFVEAGLTATLVLAGVAADDAVLATFAYRLMSYWLPLPAAVVGMLLHRRRYAASPGPARS
ncbi:MAG TPA: flippase-like domain-containing protein [Baekduia sp.]|nr:flippase-like domain-containing protein [Baekduia sp.]